MAIKVTKRAYEKLEEALRSSGMGQGTYLRIGVMGGGCSGLSYKLEFEDTVNAENIAQGREKVFISARELADEHTGPVLEVFEAEQFKKRFPADAPVVLAVPIVINTKSYIYLAGVLLDWRMDGLTGGFVFENPNAKASCGCGQSFTPGGE